MSNFLSVRLDRLERHRSAKHPYSHLSDEELDARIQIVTRNIEDRVGMSISAYADVVSGALQADEPIPGGWSRSEAQQFVASIAGLSKDGARSCSAT